MKIFFITNLFPFRIGQTYVGKSYIEKRLSILEEKYSIDYEIAITWFRRTKLLKFLRKITGKGYKIKGEGIVEKILGKDPYILSYKLGVLDGFYKVFSQRYEYLKTIETITQNDLPANLSNFDLIYSHGMYSPVPAGLLARELARKFRLPYIIHLHGTDVKSRGVYGNKIFLKALEDAERCIFVSNELFEKAKKLGYSGKNAEVTANGFDHYIFALRDKDDTRRELGIYNPSTFYVGFVGNLLSVKRADKLPDIFMSIKKEISNVTFIIVGDGPLREMIKKRIGRLNYIITGYLNYPDVAKYINAMDVLILPSRSESFGTVLIEAMACGTVPVGSSNGGIPEAIGFDDLIVPEGKDFEKRFALKVVQILREGYDVEKLFSRAQNFTWENIVDREYSICQEVVSTFRNLQN